MNDSMAQPGHSVVSLELPGWKTALSWTGAIAISLLFLASGIWKITDAHSAAVRMTQALVPGWASLPAAIEAYRADYAAYYERCKRATSPPISSPRSS